MLRIPHIRNTHHNHPSKPGAAFTNAPASAKTSHIQGATAPHRHNVQPGTTAAYRHKSIPFRPPQSSTLKKARGVCRGAAALRPLCGFPIFAKKYCVRSPPRTKHSIFQKYFFTFCYLTTRTLYMPSISLSSSNALADAALSRSIRV